MALSMEFPRIWTEVSPKSTLVVERLDERRHLLMVHKSAPAHSIKSRVVPKSALARERVNDQSPAEKLGQLVAGLYILLVAKIMRKVHKKKEFRREFQVKEVPIDKANVTVMCTLCGDLVLL